MNTTTIKIQTKFIVVSLPRTGTLSACQMFASLGFACEHPVGPYWEAFAGRYDREVLADTPMFVPSVIKKVLANSDTVKFVYLNKNPQDWITSMEKVGLAKNYSNAFNAPAEEKAKWGAYNHIDHDSLFEVLGGDWTEENARRGFATQKLAVEQLIPADRLLAYHFSQGWEPLCDFIGEPVPNIPVPHMNIDTMYDQLDKSKVK